MWHAAVSVLIALALAVPSVLALPARSSFGQTVHGATMTVLKGEVAVLHPDGSAAQPAPSGTTVSPGDEIRTLSRSGALITFFVGTEIALGEDSIMLVERVSRTGDEVDVSLKQVFGTSLHRVQTLAEAGSSYRVEVGGAVALVRGTVFAVGYNPPDRVLYVQEGALDCDQQPLQQGGYWNSGDNGCGGLQPFTGDSDDPWSVVGEGLGLAAASRNQAQRDADKEDDHRADESEPEDEEDEEEVQRSQAEREEEEQRHKDEHKNLDKPGHQKNDDKPGHQDR
jgi:hypothetical protein